jgi:hypothetical protein
MIDVKSFLCLYEGCKTRPNFNYEGEKKPLYCVSHKLEGMINIRSKICIYPDCKIIPNYNIQGEKQGLYCSGHKLHGMVNVTSKPCIYSECRSIPVFNIEGEKQGFYCSKHKLHGMVNVINKSCIYQDCKTIAVWNIEGEKQGLYCSKHRLDGMINVKSKTCKNEWCYISPYSDKYEGYCLRCFMYIFPDKPISRNYKTKEKSVEDFVKKSYPDLSWIDDKQIKDGCSKRRPDLLLDLGYQVLIIEIDENQHIGYDCSCENKRIMELSQDVGHRPIIFIRFNPDNKET